MAYIVVENFSAGLDTRRHPLTAKPGTLQTLNNAHISRGGEIEKRKAFELINSPNQNFSSPLYGLQATSDKIYTFASGGGSGAYGNNGLYVQYLSHPRQTFFPYQPVPELVGVPYSTLYGGKTFIITKWDNGDIIPYLDGEFISDFYLGTTRSWMQEGTSYPATPWDRFCSTILWQINGKTFSAPTSTAEWSATSSSGTSNSYGYIDVTAPLGVDFDPSYSIGPEVTAFSPYVTTSVLQEYVAPIEEVLAKGGFSITSGSSGSASAHKYMGGYSIAGLPGITGLYIDGVEIFGLGTGSPIYGTTVPQYGPGHGDPAPRLAWTLCSLINAGTANHGYSATYVYSQFSGADAAVLTILADPKLGSTMNGKTIQFEYLSDPGENPTDYLTTDNVISPYDTSPIPTRYIGNFGGGTLTGGFDNSITSVTVDGVEALGSTVRWAVSNTDTMIDVASKINNYTGSVDFTASVASGKLTLTATAGSGSSLNGKVVRVATTGTLIVSSIFLMSGGVDEHIATRKVVRYTIGGAYFYPDQNVTLIATKKLDEANPIYWGATRVTNSKAVAALTHKTKAHIGASSSLFFSGVNQPTKWGQDGVGAGFINMSNNSGGNEILTALALYQSNVASFSRRTVQMWSIDTDPANNRQGQVLLNTGAFGQKSVISVGDIDIFYLSDSGVRSIRARDSSNSAVVNDVGTPIDGLILDDIFGMTEDEKANCSAIIEPIDGRYWVAIGDKIYVYSYFPSSHVAAWSTYEPGHSFTEFTTKDGKVYAKEGNSVYVYGGLSGNLYDSSPVEVILPYLDGGKPAHMKTMSGIDMTCEGEWSVEIGMDPISPSARDLVATVSQPTFTLGRIQATGMGTHVGVRLTCDSAGYARLANLIVHIDFNESD
jgi:hypothetical protein